MAAVKNLSASDRLAKVADRALETTGGDRAEAVKVLAQAINLNGTLYRALMGPWVARAAWEFIRMRATVARQDFWRGAQAVARQEAEQRHAESHAAGLRAMARTTAKSILDEYVLPNGKALGDASRTDLEAAIELHRHQASAAQRSARWYALIIEAMGDADCVRDVLDDTTVTGLQVRAMQAD